MSKPLDMKKVKQKHLQSLTPFVEACVVYINGQIITIIQNTPARKLDCTLSHTTVAKLREVLDGRTIDAQKFLQEISPLVEAIYKDAGYNTNFEVVGNLIEVAISLKD